MALQIEVTVRCDYEHAYLPARCVRLRGERTQMKTTATWNGTDWDVDLPREWRVRRLRHEKVATHECPECAAPGPL